MSRIPKWKGEKSKVKVVFRLQFHATHIPQPGWDKLYVSFIPADTGKVTTKTTKASVKNGSCKWSDPIYETTRLLQDVTTKAFDEKLCKLVVATGTSRSSLLGEVDINLAEYVDALKPSSVSLPLNGCDFGTVLHVTVQLLTSKTGFREFEQQRELSEKGLHMTSGQRRRDPSKILAASESTSEQADKVNSKVRFKADPAEISSLEEMGQLHEGYEDSATGIDDSSNTSGSLYAEKNDSTSTHEIDSFKSTISNDLVGYPLGESLQPELRGNRLSGQGSNDWIHGWNSDYPMDNDFASACEENSKLRVKLERAESTILQFKLETNSLQSLADKLGAETQSLAEQFAAELASGKELNREVSILKSECLILKSELEEVKLAKTMEQLPSMKTNLPVITKHKQAAPLFDGKLEDNNFAVDRGFMFHAFQNKWHQDLLLIETKIREIQTKACIANYGSNTDLYSDFEVLDHAVQSLKQTSLEMVEGKHQKENQTTAISPPEFFIQGKDLERSYGENCYPEGMLHSLGGSDQVSYKHGLLMKNLSTTTVMEEKICELLNELDKSKSEKDSLTRKMNEMECYYEALIQQLEESQKQTQNDLENIKIEHSSCLYTVAALEGQIEKMHKDMNEQCRRYAEDKHRLDSLNNALEKRAVASETALKRVRWNYSVAVDRLQKDLELLSFQVLSMYETNENLAKQAFTDASELYSHFYTEEPLKEMKLHLYEDDSWISSQQEHYRPSITSSKSETLCMKTGNESSPMSNGVLEKVSYKASKDEGSAYVNGLRSEKNEHVASEDDIQETKVLVLHPFRSAGTQRNDELPRMVTSFESNLDCQGSINVKSQRPCTDPDNRISHDKVGLEEMKLSVHALKEIYSRAEAELSEMHVLNMHWEIYSKVLQEILHDVNDESRYLKNKVDELAQQLEHSTEIKESLMHKLQFACDEARILRDKEDKYISRYNDLALKNHNLEQKLQDVSDENAFLTQKASEYESLILDYRVYESKYNACTEERMELETLLKEESLQKTHLQSEIGFVMEGFKALKEEFNNQSLVKDDLQRTVAYLQEKLGDMCSRMVSFSKQMNGPALDGIHLQMQSETKNYMAVFLHLEQFQQELYRQFLDLCKENKVIEEERDIAQCSLRNIESQILFMKQEHEANLEELASKLHLSNALVEKLELELKDVKEKLMISSNAEESHLMKTRELLSELTKLENELQGATNENKELVEKLLFFEDVQEELERTKLSHVNCIQENQSLMMAIHSKNEVSIQMENELSGLKESLRCMNEELQLEKGFRQEFEAAVADLTSQLQVKSCQLLSFDEQKDDLVNLRQKVLDQESQISELHHLLSLNEECQGKVDAMVFSLHQQVSDLESQLASASEYSLSTDAEATFMKSQYNCMIQKLCDQLRTTEMSLSDLHVKHVDVVALLQKSKASEAQVLKENTTFSNALESVKLELEAMVSERNSLIDCINKNNVILSEVEDLKARFAMVEADNRCEKYRYEDEICQLKDMLMNDEEVDNLRSSRVELEITNVILRSKLNEQQTWVLFLEKSDAELRKLKEQHNELTYKLSDQILKTEEYKNLSTHLRELKDKAETDCHRAREKKESEASSLAMQDSLRIAFIKEQCETKVQELKNQLFASKKHAEEMLLKLQNALDEVESGRKSELSLAKRNEELARKVSDLESELQVVVNDRRELVRAYDRVKAELECTILSLDCFKEEKLKLEASLQECNEERTKIRVELDLVKRLLENMASTTGIQVRRKHEPCLPNATSIGQILEDGKSGTSLANEEPSTARDIYDAKYTVPETIDLVYSGDMDRALSITGMSNSYEEMKDPKLVHNESSGRSLQPNLEALQSGRLSKSRLEENTMLEDRSKRISEIKAHTKEQERLKAEMDHLCKELERLKNENLSSLLPLEDHHIDLALQGIERELTQLEKANEHLGSLFPSFKEFPGSGNALERVLALEVELAEALQMKSKPAVRFQSSFLKQHNDEAAVFQSFRDINELIKDMLDLKKRNASVETELKDMHGRYSQLSLQFAEVEGERQKLLMTLKNRTPKKS